MKKLTSITKEVRKQIFLKPCVVPQLIFVLPQPSDIDKLLTPARLIVAGMVPMMRNVAFCPWCPGFQSKSNGSNVHGTR